MFRAHTLILQKRVVSSGKIFEKRILFVIGLGDAGLMGSELGQFGLENGGILVCYRFLVENKHRRNVVVVDLVQLVSDSVWRPPLNETYLLLQIFKHLLPLLLH